MSYACLTRRLEDTDSLHVVNSCCLVSCGAWGVRQIKTNMEMDSHEERLHNMIQDSKREAAKEEAGRRAKELREKQKEAVSPAQVACNGPLVVCLSFCLQSRLWVLGLLAIRHHSPFIV